MENYKKRKKADTPEKTATSKALRVIDMRRTASDPQGSYTGTGENRYEKPVQDADDL